MRPQSGWPPRRMREPPTSLLKVKSRVRVVALLVGVGALCVTAAAVPATVSATPTGSTTTTTIAGDGGAVDAPDRHPHRACRCPRGCDTWQQHSRNPDAAAASDRGTDHHGVTGAARHGRPVCLGRRTSSGLFEEPDAGVDRRRRQRHGPDLSRFRPLRSAGPRQLSASFPVRRSPATSITPTSA